MKIVCDVDGVLRDFTGKLTEVYKREHPGHFVAEIQQFVLHPFFPIGDKIYSFMYGVHGEEIFTKARPYDGAGQFLEHLQAAGHQIWIATNNVAHPEWTLRWLKGHNIPYDSLMFTRRKEFIRGDILLDDCTDNLICFERETGALGCAFDRPWNQDWDRLRVDSYREFEALIRTLPEIG